MKISTPVERLALLASSVAVTSAIFAPAFDNNPAEVAPLGFVIGFLAGLPMYVAAAYRRRKMPR